MDNYAVWFLPYVHMASKELELSSLFVFIFNFRTPKNLQVYASHDFYILPVPTEYSTMGVPCKEEMGDFDNTILSFPDLSLSGKS